MPPPDSKSSDSKDSTKQSARAQPIDRDSKLALLRANRERLDQDLIGRRLRFESMPRVVEFQLSNFCNMSCTMCYDGNNPPMLRLPDDVVREFAREVFPTASVLSPFVGSEPLIITWDLARDLATEYGLELDIITNAQYLDEAKFHELEPLVSSVSFSIDSHLREIYERIRLKSKPDQVFANLPVAARLCREHGIEPRANVVFMVENAPYLDETVAYLADQGCTTINVLAFLCPPTVGSDRAFSDALQHLSPEWVDWMLKRIEAIAKQKQVRVQFEGRQRHVWDHLPKDVRFRDNGKERLSPWNELPYFLPGYCVQSVDHIKVQADGSAYPCCVAEGETLKLGNVTKQSFDEVWNGRESQDLRRAMLTGDLPEICKTCSFHTAWVLPEQDHLPMIDWYHDVHAPERSRIPNELRTLEVESPPHMAREETAPTFRWWAPDHKVQNYVLTLGVGGTFHERNLVFEIPGDATEFPIPAKAWREVQPSIAMWWMLYAYDGAEPANSTCAAKLRCIVRHEPIPRVEGSTLYD